MNKKRSLLFVCAMLSTLGLNAQDFNLQTLYRAACNFCLRANKEPKIKVAGITVRGEISWNVAAEVIRQIEAVQQHPDIKGVLLMIDSPGGCPGSSNVIYDELGRLRESMPVVCFVPALAASGGYFVACGADWIIASPSSSIGSIGVRTEWLYLSGDKKEAKLGTVKGEVELEMVTAGEFKGMFGNPFASPTPELRDFIQERINRLYEHFCSVVAASRSLTVDQVKELAHGETLIGVEALEVGLVDETGCWSGAKRKLQELIIECGLAAEGEIEIISLD